MPTTPSPGEYIAFSLRIAQQKIGAVTDRRDYRVVHPEVYQLGGINQVQGLVYDRETQDVILVGQYTPDRPWLTLDDFAVALRARLLHGAWPTVSIDSTEYTARTGMQRVRFEGGIEETQFGADLFEADYRLKQLAIGLLPLGIPGLMSSWERGEESLKTSPKRSFKITSRFWFYPVLPSVAVREDVVAVKGLKVGVFTEVLAAELDGNFVTDLSNFRAPDADAFAKDVTERFAELARVHRSFARLQGLDELVALARAIEILEDKPALSFWLTTYPVQMVKTQREVQVLTRREDATQPRAHRGSQGYREMSGGVELMAIALRFHAGDVTALRDAVQTTRPQPNALTWSFVVGEWLIPTSPGLLSPEDSASLFAQAVFLAEKKHYDDAIALYGKLIELQPDWNQPHTNRGAIYAKDKRQHDRAIADFTKALEIEPQDALAYSNRGMAYSEVGQYTQAIADCTQALAIAARLVSAYLCRGHAYTHTQRYAQAVAEYTEALQIDPRAADTYLNRGVVRGQGLGQYGQAIADFNRALELNPTLFKAYTNRGIAYAKGQRQYDIAIADFTKALELAPGDAETYYNRGFAYADIGGYDRAIHDYTRALDLNPRLAEAYFERGTAYAMGPRQYDKAIADFTRAAELKPSDAKIYYNKALACEQADRIREAIQAYKDFLQKAPSQDIVRLERARNRIRALEK
jgi:tetratricopeptide (TPR) repeat protein